MKALLAALLVAAFVAGNASAASGVGVRVSYEMSSFFTEGYVWFASLDGKTPKRLTGKSVLLPAKPGRHVLRVYIRPCDGNCSFLDPPLQRCSKTVRAGQKVTYHLRDNGCKLTVRG
jgi:hypothetical protein